MKATQLVLAALLCLLPQAHAADAIYRRDIQGDFDTIYKSIYASLEKARFYVVFEANIGRSMQKNAESWGEDYNRNKYEEARSLVICNPYYANQLLNLDPKMLALCPMNVTVLYKNGTATALFERLTPSAGDSPAVKVLWEIENTIIGAIEDVPAAK